MITLKSEILKVTKINRKTKAQMFENLKVGDTIQLSVSVKYAGRNRGTYATYIQIKNIKTGEITHSSFNQIDYILDAFEFKEELWDVFEETDKI
jgi:ribosomal protein L19